MANSTPGSSDGVIFGDMCATPIPFDPAKTPLNRASLEPLACWFSVDSVPRKPDVTEFKRRARLHQASWRARAGLPMGTHGKGDVPNGSRLHPKDGAALRNFLSETIQGAVVHRLHEQQRQSGQQLDEARLKNDLLSSMPMCFNLFGEVHGNSDALASASKALWGVEADGPAELLFEWSPQRHSHRYTGDGTAFDVAFALGHPSGPRQIVGIETKYHEHSVSEVSPNATTRLPRYLEIVEASGVFQSGWEAKVLGTDLQQIWRDHLLLLAMIYPTNDEWSGGKYCLVYPAKNPSFREAGERYRDVLTDDVTFDVRSIEELLDQHVLHSPELESAFRNRYLW